MSSDDPNNSANSESSNSNHSNAFVDELSEQFVEEDHCYNKSETPAAHIDIAEDNTVVVSVGDLIHKVAQKNVNSEAKKRDFCTTCTKRNICCVSSQSYNSNNKKVKNKIAIRNKPKPPPNKFAPMYLELCNEHIDMYLLEDEKLVKPGDKFESHDHFVQYLNENAKRWCYYYKCTDSRKPNTPNETYTYRCIYLRSKQAKYESKGLRKRINAQKTDCPCKIKLRRLKHEEELTAVYVCNHHDHEFSVEQFHKLQHGRRLPPDVKDDIMDFLTLQVPRPLIKKYVQLITGFEMSTTFFYTLEKNLQKRNKKCTQQLTEERLLFLNEQIAALAELCPESKAKGKKKSRKDEDDDEHSDDEATKELRRQEAVRKIFRLKANPSTIKPIRNSLEVTSKIKYTATLPNGSQMEGSVEVQNDPWVPDESIPVMANTEAVILDTGTQKIKVKRLKLADENSNANNSNLTPVTNAHITYIDSANDIETEQDTNEYIIEDADMDASNVEYLTEANDTLNEIEYVTEVENNAVHENVIQSPHNIVEQGTQLQPRSKPVLHLPLRTVKLQRRIDGVDKSIQTTDDEVCSNSDVSDNEDSEIVEFTQDENGDNYVKYDYVHKYNIDQYMTHPQFPKYIDILSKQTNTDVLEMFTNVYNEKAMFQLITTQRGTEGNTKMRYINDCRMITKGFNETKRRKLGEKLQSILILKEKIRVLKARNKKLVHRNEHLQDMAFRKSNFSSY